MGSGLLERQGFRTLDQLPCMKLKRGLSAMARRTSSRYFVLRILEGCDLMIGRDEEGSGTPAFYSGSSTHVCCMQPPRMQLLNSSGSTFKVRKRPGD